MDASFVSAVREQVKGHEGDYASHKRLYGLLTALSHELPDQPLFMDLPSMSSAMGLSCPSNAAFESAVRNAGYRLSHSHTCPTAVKTDAPRSDASGVVTVKPDAAKK